MSQNKIKNNNMLERAWRYYKHADDLSAGRINFFLVAESMLIISFVALSNEPSSLRLCIIALGLVYTFSWLYVNARLSKRMEVLNNHLIELDPLYTEYMDAVGGISSKIVLCYLLPIATIVFWLLLLFYSILRFPFTGAEKTSMQGTNVLAVLGLGIGVLASIFLAVSLGHLIRAVMLSINAFDVTLQSYSSGKNVPVFTGLDQHLRKGIIHHKMLSIIGFLLLGISFALQVIGLILYQ